MVGGVGLAAALVFSIPLALRFMSRGSEPDPYIIKRLRLNDQSLFVQVPTTPQRQAQGLGGRDRLADTWGMMWRYDEPQQVTFWMKDMKFPLDFIWIRGGQVIGLTMNVQPPVSAVEELKLIRPPAPVDRVVEVNAGYAHAHRIAVGTKVTEFDF